MAQPAVWSYVPGQRESVGVGEEMRQWHVVRGVEPGRDPQALLALELLRPLLQIRVAPLLAEGLYGGVYRRFGHEADISDI